MADAFGAGNLDIVSGRWVEAQSERPLAFTYLEGRTADGAVINKIPVFHSRKFDGQVILADDVLATMLCRRSLFETVSFDDRFDFYFELFDFFMSCRTQKIRIGVAADAVFDHRPTAYRTVSTRQTQSEAVDRTRFVEKWGCAPVLHARPDAPGLGQVSRKIVGKVRKLLR